MKVDDEFSDSFEPSQLVRTFIHKRFTLEFMRITKVNILAQEVAKRKKKFTRWFCTTRLIRIVHRNFNAILD